MNKNINLELLWEAHKDLTPDDKRTFNDIFIGVVSMGVSEIDWKWCIETTMEALKKGREEKNENS